MKNLRKGALIGIISGLLTIFGLYLNLFEFKASKEVEEITEQISNEEVKKDAYSLSINDMKTEELIGSKGQEAWGVIFNLYAALAVLTIVFSYLSNYKNLLGIITALVGLINLGFTALLYTTGKEKFSEIEGLVDFSFGIGMYLLLVASVASLVGSILAVIKR